jgi:hypothetical protein
MSKLISFVPKIVHSKPEPDDKANNEEICSPDFYSLATKYHPI